MRLMAGGSAAQVEINWGVVLALITPLIALPMILLGKPKLIAVGWLLLAIGELLAAFYLLWGLRRLYRTLNANQPAQSETPPEELKVVSATERDLLPQPPASVTEGTTELMDSQPLSTSAKPAKTTGALD
jgi:hypothetical protein